MSINTAPAFVVQTTITRLHRDRNYQPAATSAERFADALLANLAAALEGRAKAPTKDTIAAAVEAAERLVRARPDAQSCPCGHEWLDHLSSRSRGCLECACTTRRPRPATGGAQR